MLEFGAIYVETVKVKPELNRGSSESSSDDARDETDSDDDDDDAKDL